MTSTTFASLPLDPSMLKNLEDLGYSAMTDVQQQALPQVIVGKDVIVRAKTGSGKTACFGIGLLNKLNVGNFRVQALVLCPTRELADQVSKELRRLARATHNIKILTLCGGMPMGPQIGSLEHGAHIVVGTPGRLLEHLGKGRLNLENLETLVLDEADRMLDMGFRDPIAEIIRYAKGQRQTLLFSATYPKDIEQLSKAYQHQPITITVEDEAINLHIEQRFYEIDKNERFEVVQRILQKYQPTSVVIFCNTKQQTVDLAQHLTNQGYSAMAINGDMEQRDRDQVLVRFSNQSLTVLVATDVAARGLDIKELPMVLNAEMTRDTEVHVHRIGRTGRAGQDGIAISLYAASESYKVNAIEDYQSISADIHSVSELPLPQSVKMSPPMVTFQFDVGKKNKVRAGDILGAITNHPDIDGSAVGKIDVFDFNAYVAIRSDMASVVNKHLQDAKIKGRKTKVRRIR